MQASVAVGITALSSEDMYMSGGYGKCIEILHVMGDTLGQLGKPPARPNLGPTDVDTDQNKLENIDQIDESNTKPLTDAVNSLEICDETVQDSNSLQEVICL